MNEEKDIIAQYKKVCEWAGVPKLIIDNPFFIEGKKPTDADIEWAKKAIEKYESTYHGGRISEDEIINDGFVKDYAIQPNSTVNERLLKELEYCFWEMNVATYGVEETKVRWMRKKAELI